MALQAVVQSGTGTGAAPVQPSGRRQDRHDQQQRRRLVQRLHPAAGDHGVDGQRRRRGADARRRRRRPGLRRHLPGPHLARLHVARPWPLRRSCRSRRPTTAPSLRPSSSPRRAWCATTSSTTTSGTRTAVSPTPIQLQPSSSSQDTTVLPTLWHAPSTQGTTPPARAVRLPRRRAAESRRATATTAHASTRHP